MDILRQIEEAVLQGDFTSITGLVERALEQGNDPNTILDKGLQQGMAEVGRRFSSGEYFIPELLIAAKAMHTATAILEPLITASGSAKNIGHVIMATVEGDIHDIGMSIVSMMLEGAGFKVTKLGVDVKPQTIVEAIQREKPQLVGLSALLSTTMIKQKVSIDALKEAGLRDQVVVMVGGAPVTQDWADKIGANGYARDAVAAVAEAKKLLGIVE